MKTLSNPASAALSCRRGLKSLTPLNRALSGLLGFILATGQQAGLLLGVLLWCAAPGPAKADYPPAPPPRGATFGGLGNLDYEAGRRLDYVSANGTVFAGGEDYVNADGNGSQRAFVWSAAGGVIPLMLPEGYYSSSSGISADGSTVVGTIAVCHAAFPNRRQLQ